MKQHKRKFLKKEARQRYIKMRDEFMYPELGGVDFCGIFGSLGLLLCFVIIYAICKLA